MKFSELIQKRYSVRAYKPDPVEDEKLQQVLEAAQTGADGGEPAAGPRDRRQDGGARGGTGAHLRRGVVRQGAAGALRVRRRPATRGHAARTTSATSMSTPPS